MSLPAGFDPAKGTFDFSSNVFAPRYNYAASPSYSQPDSSSQRPMTSEELTRYSRELAKIAATDTGSRSGGIIVGLGNW